MFEKYLKKFNHFHKYLKNIRIYQRMSKIKRKNNSPKMLLFLDCFLSREPPFKHHRLMVTLHCGNYNVYVSMNKKSNVRIKVSSTKCIWVTAVRKEHVGCISWSIEEPWFVHCASHSSPMNWTTIVKVFWVCVDWRKVRWVPSLLFVKVNQIPISKPLATTLRRDWRTFLATC